MPKINYICIKHCVYNGTKFKPGEMISSLGHPGDCFKELQENDPERFYRAQHHEPPRKYDIWAALKE